MIKNTTTMLSALTTFVASSSIASATISIVDSYTGASVDANTDYVNLGTGAVWTLSASTLGLSAAAGESTDKLVVGFSQRRNVGITVTYGGALMDEAVSLIASGNNDGTAGIFYLDNFDLSSDLVITSSGTGTVGDLGGRTLFAYVLSGTAVGGPPPSGTDTDNQTVNPTTVSVTTGSEGGFVIGAFGVNGSPQNNTLTVGTDTSYSSAVSLHATWNGTTSTTYSMSRADNDAVGVMAAFAPEAIPEPSSTLLLGLIGITGLIHRRRS